MLGDSYLEGFGVDYGERTSDLLEQMTGIEHLNLGITDFGTIQEWLAYERFGLRYEHSKVIVFIFPENDFDNNDPNDESKNVYRPFLRKTGTGFEVYYTVDFDDRYTGSISASTVIKNRFDNAIYTANVGRWATRALKTVYEEKKPVEAATHYNGYSREDMEVMRFALGRLVDLAGDRPVYLVIVPTIVDLEYAAINGTDSQLIEDIDIFSAARPNVRLIDLVPYFLEDAQTTGRDFWDYTLGCDRHWSLAGHRLVAESLFKEIYPEAQ